MFSCESMPVSIGNISIQACYGETFPLNVLLYTVFCICVYRVCNSDPCSLVQNIPVHPRLEIIVNKWP